MSMQTHIDSLSSSRRDTPTPAPFDHHNNATDETMDNTTDDNADYIEEIERSPCELDTVQRLQAENAALRDELQALRSVTQLQASAPDSGTRHIFDFLGLPRELRDAIYELCVVVGEVRINRRGSLEEFDMRYYGRRDPKAAVQLFRVNKQIRSEALELYLSKNHFVVPAACSTGTCDPFRYIPGDVDGLASQYLRSISISVDGSDNSMFAARIFDEGRCAKFRRDNGGMGENVHLGAYHEETVGEQSEFLPLILESVFSRENQVQRLQINLEWAMCALGCHRLVEWMIYGEQGPISQGAVIEEWAESIDHSRFESLDFLGTVNDMERRYLLSLFPPSMTRKITFHGKFDPDLGSWDPCVEVVMDNES